MWNPFKTKKKQELRSFVIPKEHTVEFLKLCDMMGQPGRNWVAKYTFWTKATELLPDLSTGDWHYSLVRATSLVIREGDPEDWEGN